ncbi:hypothetical protein O3P69_008492 [Scylla paramamosain]|uniref:Uncharacterized protein n=1 Tax=Scylla paramamosain TaxID=85552 RepID=A0AAW0SM02_SCYPA
MPLMVIQGELLDMCRAWWTCLLLLGVVTAIEKPSGSDVVQFMVHKDTISASAAVEDHPDLINWRDEKGWSLLHYAAWHGSSKVIYSLVKTGAEVNLKDLVVGLTPLMVAAEKGHEEALKTLVKVGANVNATDTGGKGVVARSGSSSVLRFLLGAGLDLDHRDSSGNTAVMEWAQEGRADMLMEALPHCPDITLANHNDLTALDVAKMNKNVNAMKIIEDKLQAMCVADGVHYPLNHTRRVQFFIYLMSYEHLHYNGMRDVMRSDVKPNANGRKLEIVTRLAVTSVSTLLESVERLDTKLQMDDL